MSPRPQPIPLRSDPDALARAAVASFVRAVIVEAMSAVDRTVNRSAYAEQRWPHDRELPLILRAATSPTSLANAPALANVAYALLGALTGASAGADLLRRGIALSFDGAALINVPGISPPSATFVGEGQPISVQQAATSPGPQLAPHKLTAIATLSGEMVRGSNAEQLVKQVLVESVGPALDAVLLSDAAAVPDVAPAGLFNGVTPLTPASTGDPVDRMVADLSALISAVSAVTANNQVAIIAAAPQAVAIALRSSRFDIPVLTSSALASGVVAAVALPALTSATEGPPRVDATTQGLVHEHTNAAPINIAGTMAVPTRSLYQTDSTALRLRWPLSWGLRSPNGVSWMQGATW
jgi:hypothetical protein